MLRKLLLIHWKFGQFIGIFIESSSTFLQINENFIRWFVEFVDHFSNQYFFVDFVFQINEFNEINIFFSTKTNQRINIFNEKIFFLEPWSTPSFRDGFIFEAGAILCLTMSNFNVFSRSDTGAFEIRTRRLPFLSLKLRVAFPSFRNFPKTKKMSENESRNCKNVRKYFRAAKNHEDLFIFLTFSYLTNFLTFLDPISDIVAQVVAPYLWVNPFQFLDWLIHF